MLKCVVLSLHRSGTRSTAQFLSDLGLRTTHWPGYHQGEGLQTKIIGRETELEAVYEAISPILDDAEAIADVPIPVLYRQLYRDFPNARFILVERDSTSWVRSVRRHLRYRRFHPYERIVYWQFFGSRPKSARLLTDQDLLWMQAHHKTSVECFFREAASDHFRCFQLEDDNAAGKIAALLGYERRGPLPHIRDRVISRNGILRMLSVR
jgi:hypothetical protein